LYGNKKNPPPQALDAAANPSSLVGLACIVFTFSETDFRVVLGPARPSQFQICASHAYQQSLMAQVYPGRDTSLVYSQLELNGTSKYSPDDGICR